MACLSGTFELNRASQLSQTQTEFYFLIQSKVALPKYFEIFAICRAAKYFSVAAVSSSIVIEPFDILPAPTIFA